MEDSKQLLNSIDKGKNQALDTFKNEIQKQLEDEIVKRYFYREGLYDYYLKNDEAILASTALLKDMSKYKGILQ